MYNLLLVDDEAAVVKGLAYDIDWSDLNISGVHKAYSVEQALQLMEWTRIDIVVTDISMPEADGIRLAANIQQRWPDAVVIFLSGYDDFQYAQKAIELGVFHYATKPVDYTEFKETVRNAVQKLEKDLIRDNALRSARESLEQLRPLLQERILSAWVVKGTENPLSHADKFSAAGLGFIPGDIFVLVVLRVEETGTGTREESGVLELVLKELATEWLLRGKEGCFFPNDQGQLVMLCWEQNHEECTKSMRYMAEVAEPFKESVKRTLDCVISVFFGEITKAEGVNAAYRKLDATIRRTVADPSGVIMLAGQPGAAGVGVPHVRLESLYEVPELSLLLDRLDLTQALERIDRIFAEVKRKHPVEMTTLLEIYHSFSGVAIQASLRHGLTLSQWAGDNERMLYPFMAAGKVSDLKKWCRAVVQSFIDHLHSVERKQFNRLVDQAKQLVDEQYARDISVAEIASYLYVHPNYLTRLFKSETGHSLMDYITKRRIENAKGLLAQPGYKVYEVAERVGYESIAHFNRMFKRETGMSPKDYQRKISQ
ncbi:helix-turn-helix domain-containing protein [Cohnella sp.]|uniref:response regulator transcription factor n=1 Tax=Cohnella sp. TaxID=1883426 RepID=UPI0035672570